MSTPARLTAFVAALAAVFGLALLAGRLLGPLGTDDAGSEPDHGMSMAAADHDEGHLPGGLQVSQDGYTLDLGETTATPGSGRPLTFTIIGPDGHPVTAYDNTHTKDLHLIAVRRDFTGFQHVHPTLSNGTWSTTLDLSPGTWRVFADFTPAGSEGLTLGSDLSVPGTVTPASLHDEESRSFDVDGYTVTLDGDLRAGKDAKLTLTVTKDGRPVTDLEPYLGAYGHLVALRDGDLAYVHVHPESSDTAGPEIVFDAAVSSAGTFHLYLDFQHDGVVHTAEFVAVAAGHTH